MNVNSGIHSNNDNSSIPAVLEEGAVGGSGLLSLSMVRLVCISYKHSLPGILLGGSGLLSLSMVRLVCISYKHSLPGILLACQV